METPINLALSVDSNIRRYVGLSPLPNVLWLEQTSTHSSSADPTTIKNKFLVGYQGWCAPFSPLFNYVPHLLDFRFYCHGDGEPVGPGEKASPALVDSI